MKSKRFRTISTGEERTTAQHLGCDTSDGPDIDTARILSALNPVAIIRARSTHAFVYCLNLWKWLLVVSFALSKPRENEPSTHVNMISGALYHLVATYSVMNPVSPPFGSAVVTDRASPKSHTFKSQFALRSRLEGLRSR